MNLCPSIIERTGYRWPRPAKTNAERLWDYIAKTFGKPLEELPAGDWPFPPPTAVHSLPRGQQTDPTELLETAA